MHSNVDADAGRATRVEIRMIRSTVGLEVAHTVARGVAAGSMLAFARSLGEFGATIMIAGNIPGQTQTIPLAIYSFSQRPGGVEESWRLVILSVAIAALALGIGDWLERRGKHDA